MNRPDDACACGSPLVSCHGCAGSRCLTCDPYSEYERLNRCCTADRPDPRHARADASAQEYALYLFIGESSLIPTAPIEAKAMYRLACRECGEAFEENDNPVPSRSIRGEPLVHEECA